MFESDPSTPLLKLPINGTLFSEAATGGILEKNLFLKVSQYSQENTCDGVCFYGA